MEQGSALGANDREVLTALARGHQPMSAYQILGKLDGTCVRAPVQVYRALEKLVRLGRVHRVESLNAFIACGREHHAAGPAFLVCKTCGSVTEIDANPAIAGYANEAAGFCVEHISLELSGICKACQKQEYLTA